MRPRAEYDKVIALVAEGLNDCAIERATGVPRRTVLDWRHGNRGARQRFADSNCPRCTNAVIDERAYSYLLGLYLGDGCLSWHRRDVYRLRIVLDSRYPGIIDECASAMATVSAGRRVNMINKKGCQEVGADWKHWPCLFPQHGPGKKHRRRIDLEEWQEAITRMNPGLFLRGFIHSDECRDDNVVNGKAYPRYSFSNRSPDILRIFCDACAAFGVRWTRPKPIAIAISRRPDVAKLDAAIGPKSIAGSTLY